METEETDYVVNSLEYEETVEVDSTAPETDKLIHQTGDGERNGSKPDVKDDELIINEAYVAVSHAASVVLPSVGEVNTQGSVRGVIPQSNEEQNSVTNN